MTKIHEDLAPTRATLLERLKDVCDESSWKEFFDIYWKLIYGVARKAGLNESEAEDVVQETFVSIIKQMPTFKYNPEVGSFKGWLLNTTRWRIVDQLRARTPQEDQDLECDTTRTAIIERVPDENCVDLDAMWDENWEKNLLAAAIRNVKLRVDSKQFQIFDLYANKDWPPEKVAQTFNVSVNQVYLAKSRITDLLRAEVARLEKELT